MTSGLQDDKKCEPCRIEGNKTRDRWMERRASINVSKAAGELTEPRGDFADNDPLFFVTFPEICRIYAIVLSSKDEVSNAMLVALCKINSFLRTAYVHGIYHVCTYVRTYVRTCNIFLVESSLKLTRIVSRSTSFFRFLWLHSGYSFNRFLIFFIFHQVNGKVLIAKFTVSSSKFEREWKRRSA